MAPIRIGVIGCSRFAERTMIPALLECADTAVLMAVASRDGAKAARVAATFGVQGIQGYSALLDRTDIQAVYLPLPVALHEEFACAALDRGKHVLVEKSFAVDYASAERIVARARTAKCLVIENFAFVEHRQMAWIREQVDNGLLGRLHLVRGAFGFPALPRDDIRNQRELGGGALLDIGCYTLRVAQLMLGSTLRVIAATSVRAADTGVDTRGAILCANAAGQMAQLSYGFDYVYHCRVELLGSDGALTADRIFTAPPGLNPPVRVQRRESVEDHVLPADNQYRRLWRHFVARLGSPETFTDAYDAVLRQARLMDDAAGAAGIRE